MSKLYIMFCGIQSIGGGQAYVNKKVEYLKNNGWTVEVFGMNEGKNYGHSPWPQLREYEKNISLAFRRPPEFWSQRYVDKTIGWMKKIVGTGHEIIIIESHTDVWADWGERLAKEINAKHICFLLDERLGLYGAKELLDFKHKRKEVAGIHKTSLVGLFDNYKIVPEEERYVLAACGALDCVQDIAYPKISTLQRYDWNIAYIGRNKQYISEVVENIIKFAKMHQNKTIQFFVVGAIEGEKNIYECKNIVLTKLGYLTPIPRSIFDFFDVVIAGAGCASLAYSTDTKTISIDANTGKVLGILGYTTVSILMKDGDVEEKTVFESLEDIFVRKICDSMEYKPKIKEDEKKLFEEHFVFIERSNKDEEYFDLEKKPQFSFPKIKRLTFLFRHHFPRCIYMYDKIRMK